MEVDGESIDYMDEDPRVLMLDGKFRPQLIELTSFKPKLLIRFIMNKTC